MHTVIKRDGSEEAWSDDKLMTSLIRSGLTTVEAKDMLEKVIKAFPKYNTKLQSTLVKETVSKAIRKTHPEVFETYSNYKK